MESIKRQLSPEVSGNDGIPKKQEDEPGIPLLSTSEIIENIKNGNLKSISCVEAIRIVDSILELLRSNPTTGQNQITFLVEHLSVIEDINSELFDKFVLAGYPAKEILESINIYKSLEENQFEMDEEGKVKIKKFDNSVALTLLDNHLDVLLINNLSKFKNLTSETARRIIDLGYLNYIFGNSGSGRPRRGPRPLFNSAGNADSFIEFDNSIADKLIESNQVKSILNSPKLFPNLDSKILEYFKKYGSKGDSTEVYKLRNKFSLNEIVENYNFYRVKSWQGENILRDDDKKFFELISNVIDEKTFGELWKDHSKEELHIIGPNIIKMSILTGENTDTFRGQFIERIIKDGASYEFGPDALSYFNNIVNSLDEDYKSIILSASNYDHTKELALKFDKEGPFKDWENLKKYYELCELLRNREVLEKLDELKRKGNNKQYEFFTKMAFHPGSKISMQTVFEFMENPARFLDVEDSHSGEAHERKKPSNYTRFEYLDITAEDLRDALIEGTLDRLQYFKPFEAKYKIADKKYDNNELVKLLKEALGSFKENIKGNAKNPGKLFKMTQELMKNNNLRYEDLITNPELISDSKNELDKLLFDKDFGIKDDRKFEEYMVKIHPKSSPEGHLAGNDTACCMPFGSGKNNVYMYNLGCSVLTVQRKVGDKYRTIAQSVLTPDVDIKHNIAELVNQVQDETLLSSVITEDLTQKKKIIIAADNIEVSLNSEKYKNSIELIYSDFISRYAHELNSNEIENSRMLIGKGYSDLNFSKSQSINNTFIPVTPVAYSDNYGNSVYELPLSEKSEIIPEPNYGILQKIKKENVDLDLPKGVSYLTAHDTLRVSYMEGKVYAENESLVQYIHRIGNELTAKDINNNFKNRPNLSIKVEDENGTMQGYMIAYEGEEKETGGKVIYVSDLAADVTKSRLAGGRLIKAFETLYRREYLDKNNPLTIVAEARETTSYKIINKQLDDLGKEYGYKFRMEEEGTERRGQDTLHFVKLIPVKI